MPPGWARKGENGLSREENGLNGHWSLRAALPIYFFPQSHFEALSSKFRGLMPTQLARLSPGDLKLHCSATGACVLGSMKILREMAHLELIFLPNSS